MRGLFTQSTYVLLPLDLSFPSPSCIYMCVPLSPSLSLTLCVPLSPSLSPPPPSLSLSLSLPHSVLPSHASALSLLLSPFPLTLQVCMPTLRA